MTSGRFSLVERQAALDHLTARPVRPPVGIEENPLRASRGGNDLFDDLLDDDGPFDDDLLHDFLLDDDRLLLLDHDGLTSGAGRTLGTGGTGRTALTLRARWPRRSGRALDIANLDFTTGSGEHTAQRYGCATEIASADHTCHSNLLKYCSAGIIPPPGEGRSYHRL